MSTQTSNLQLVKQANNENWSNDIHNANLQKIDDFAGTLKATTLVSGTNFNDLTVPNTGAHVLYNGSNISQMTNVPTEVASQAWPFLVECFKVGAGGSGYYTRQILHVYATTSSPVNIFVRSQSYIGSGTGWLGWEKLTNKNAPISYFSLIDRVAISKTATDYTFYNNRSLATYPTISIQPIIGGYFRQGLVIPRNHFNSASNGKFSLTYPSGGENVEIVLNYVNDTKINMKYNATGTFTVEMIIDGLVNG